MITKKEKVFVVCYQGKPFLSFKSEQSAIYWLKENRNSQQIKGEGWNFTGGFTIHEVVIQE